VNDQLVAWLRRISTAVGFALLTIGFFAVAWPAPLFTLNEPYLTGYIVNVLQVPIDKDRSAGAGLPYLWMFITMPVGVLLMAGSITLLHWGTGK